MRLILLSSLFFALTSFGVSAQLLGPEVILQTVYANNSELMSLKAVADAEDASIASRASPDNPRLGVMQEKNMSPSLTDMGTMKFITVSQDINFPAKYFVRGSMQNARANAAKEDYLNRKWEIRQNSLTSFFGYYTGKKILGLLEAQKVTLHEIARIVEGRRSSGSVSQQDEMRAHVEQTNLKTNFYFKSKKLWNLR